MKSLEPRELSFLRDVSAKIFEYLSGNSEAGQRVTPALTPDEVCERMVTLLPLFANAYSARPMPGLSTSEVEQFINLVLELSVTSAHEGFANQLYGGFVPEGVAGEWLTAVLNTSMATFEISPLFSVLEHLFFRRMRALVGFPETPQAVYGGGTLVPGGSNGNMVALLTARNRRLGAAGRENGLFGSPQLVAFVSKESHYSYEKAANIVGIGTRHLVAVDCDDHGRMSPKKLEQAMQNARAQGLKPFFVGATSGTTVKAAFDPLEELATLAHGEGAWFHVDAAMGGCLLFSAKNRWRLDGLSQADSFVWDAHKMLNLPLVASVMLFRDPGSLLESNGGGGEAYLFHDTAGQGRSAGGICSWDSGEMSLQCGRRPDILKVALALWAVGEIEWGRRIDVLLARAERFARVMATDGRFEMVAPVQSTSLCFRVLPRRGAENTLSPEALSEFQISLRQSLLREGRHMVNYSFDEEGHAFFRVVLLNHRQEDSDLQELLSALLRLAGYDEGSLGSGES